MTQSTVSPKANAFKAGAINSISMEVAREKAPAIFATETA